MHACRLSRSRWALVALLSISTASCSGRLESTTRPNVDPLSTSANTVAPASASQPGFYPLAVGNHWTYFSESVFQRITDTGPLPPETYRETLAVEITQAGIFDGRQYLIEQTTILGPNGGLQLAEPLRQDATGLYEWSPILEGHGRGPARSRADGRQS